MLRYMHKHKQLTQKINLKENTAFPSHSAILSAIKNLYPVLNHWYLHRLKFKLVLPFWYWFIYVVLEKQLSNGCGSSSTHTHTRLTALFWDYPDEPVPEGKSNLDFTETRDSEWQWHQLGNMQVCT